MKVKPVLKWVGGKRQLIDELKKNSPKNFNTYYEPFVGGGALLFELEPKKAVINDLNKELIDIYQTIRSRKYYETMTNQLDRHEKNHSKEYYYEIRDLDRNTETFSKISKPKRAARTIYLNKSCFNGIYRVNSKGEFNVPFNGKQKVVTYDRKNIENMHNYFIKNEIIIRKKDFKNAVIDAQKGDFVYFDPPYDPIENKKSFTSYTKIDFTKKDQKRLRDTFVDLDKRDVFVMLSNHNTEYIRELYKGYKITVVNAKRMVNSDASNRGFVEEVIITNY